MTERIIDTATGLCDDVCCVVICAVCEHVLYPTWARMCDCEPTSKSSTTDNKDVPCDSP